jgi:hypothetical protein
MMTTTAADIQQQLINGYPHWCNALPTSRQVESLVPKAGSYTKILHEIQGVNGETQWNQVLHHIGAACGRNVVESDLSSVEAFIERYPTQGDLEFAAWQRLAAAIEQCGFETSCYVWMEPFQLHPPQDACWHSEASKVKAVVHLPSNYYNTGPHKVWATDLSWFVISDIDLAYTIVSGPEELGEHLVSDRRLEAFMVAADQRLA